MCALQMVDIPGYAAIVFRKTLTDLKQPGALLDRAHQWLDGTPAKYEGGTHTFHFPTFDADGYPSVPSKVQFGYIGEQQAYLRYQGAEFQCCCFDEVNQIEESDFRYLFSRLRKLACPIHKTINGKPNYVPGCPICTRQKSVPLRMRCSTNPGGFPWVKQWYRIKPDIDPRIAEKTGQKVKYLGTHPKRPFIPSFISDNEFLDQETYLESLDELDPVTKAMLKDGRWDVSPDARFKRAWVRYYSRRGDYFTLGPDGTGAFHHHDTLQRVFVTVDPATSSKHGPGDILSWKKQPSYTVISVWGLTQDYNLLWLDMIRFRREVPDVILALKRVRRMYHPDVFYIDGTGVGQGVYQTAANEGLTVQPIHTRIDKVVNSTEAMVRMSQGRVWFPQEASWLSIAEDEIFFWTGNPTSTDDVVDTLSNAARVVSWEDAQVVQDIKEPGLDDFDYTDDLPSIVSELSYLDSDNGTQYYGDY